MNETYLLILPLVKDTQSWNWTAIGIGASTVTSAIMASLTFIGLKKAWIKNSTDYKYNNSRFYLEQAKVYLNKAVFILSKKENNNIKWHQAIQLLKISDSLKYSITDSSHQHIYLIDYIDTAYEIGEIVKSIDDPRFFYGVEDYEDKDSILLYRMSNPLPPAGLEGSCLRISPELLRDLCLFLDTAGKASFDLNENGSSEEHVFHSSYFKKSIKIKTGLDFDEFTRANYKVLFAYINEYEKYEQEDLKKQTP